ncbi:hypothetical protein MVES_000086 [Malassezia vespertilionis]|uniref:Leu5p n=1 Tax=Malassezia vespertilionis TaxID=2020962 RepID=A0A2N1JHF6_9BASI|nr:hypothetical protein MVES_000086 [Malassezia vespertilionis]
MTTSAPSAPNKGRVRRQDWDYILRSGLSGGIAGCAAKTAIAPLDRVKILFQAANPEFKNYSGFAALYQGHTATLLRIFPYAAIKYMTYDMLHATLMPTSQSETSTKLFLAGSLSGVLSVFVTYPLELIRVRLAFDTKIVHHQGSLRFIISSIFHEGTQQHESRSSGVSELLYRFPLLKFYRGFFATVLGMIPYAGTSFLVFGQCKSFMYRTFLYCDSHGAPLRDKRGKNPLFNVSRSAVDLASGAIAGAISQTASYPLEVVRRRQQVSGILSPERMLSLGDTIKWIYNTSGIRGFYTGLSIGYIKVVPMTAISYAVWFGMKRQLGIL